MKHIEDDEQAALFDWLQIMHPLLFKMAFAIPNGGMRSAREGARLKMQGVKSGVPDLFIAISTDEYHGLFIEMKKPIVKGEAKARISDSQKEWIDHLLFQGYQAIVCFGCDEAIKQIQKHYKIVQKMNNRLGV